MLHGYVIIVSIKDLDGFFVLVFVDLLEVVVGVVAVAQDDAVGIVDDVLCGCVGWDFDFDLVDCGCHSCGHVVHNQRFGSFGRYVDAQSEWLV